MSPVIALRRLPHGEGLPLPAYESARLVATADPVLAQKLGEIPYSSAVTLAFGTPALVASVTVPRMEPVGVCPQTNAPARNRPSRHTANVFMPHLSLNTVAPFGKKLMS